jgi:hypothetical protein
MRLFFFVVLLLFPASGITQQKPLALHQVKTIYIDPDSGEIAAHLKQRLLDWPEITLTEKREEADAILSVAAEVHFSASGNNGNINTHTQATGSAHLIDRRSGSSIWKTEKGRGKGFFRHKGWASSLSKLATLMIDQLKSDWTTSQKAAQK